MSSQISNLFLIMNAICILCEPNVGFVSTDEALTKSTKELFEEIWLR